MTELEPAEVELFGRARRALSPSEEDRTRVLQQLAPLLTDVPGSASPVEMGSRRSRWIRIGGGLVALGVAVAAGYGWGYRTGLAVRSAPAVAGSARLASVPSGVAAALSATTAVDERLPVAAAERTPPSRAKSSAAHVPALPDSAPAPAPGLDEEVRQLRRIDRAIRDLNPRLALAISDNLDRDIPRGQLLVERSAARLMAGCQLDVEGGAPPAARFLESNPQTAYAVRLRELCRLPSDEQRNAAPLGTHNAEKGGAP